MSSFYRRKYKSIEVTVGPSYWPVLGWTALVAFVQTVLAPYLTFHGGLPSLVTIAVVLYAARTGARRGAMLALPAGLLEDVFAGTYGGWTVGTTVAALLVGGLSRRMFADGAFVRAVLCGGAVLVRAAAFWTVMRIEGYPNGFAVQHAHAAAWSAFLTATVAFAWLIVRARVVTDKTTVERYGFG